LNASATWRSNCGQRNMSSISSIAGGLLHSIFAGSPASNSPAAGNLARIPASPTQLPDTGELSPFAQLASTLQQLQQSNPAQYKLVTQQVAANLQSAAQTVQSGGNTTGAAQLNQLATDFTNASANGQLPNLQDLASAVGGHHGHTSTTGSAFSQLLSSLQTTGTQSSSLNAATIIQNTLTSAGISV
jgi:hypothetical protein